MLGKWMMGVPVLAATVLLASSPFSSASPLVPHAKHLSKSSVSVGSLFAGPSSAEYAAIARGYYKQQGLTVQMVNTTAAASDVTAALIGGSWDFAITPTEATTIAEEAGGPIRPIMAHGYGTTDELAVSATVAAADHISASGLTGQTQALKGSHLTIGISNTTSGTYLNLVAYLQKNGVTYAGPNSDVSFQQLGSATVLTAALASGKIQAIANTPPVTVVSGAITIAFGLAKPINSVTWESLDATTSLIQNHADTVQAFVTATTEGWQYARTHPAVALKEAVPYYVTSGITSPEEITYLASEKNDRVASTSPAITRSGFNGYKYVLDIASTTRVTQSCSQLVDNRFVNKAIKALHLQVPLGC